MRLRSLPRLLTSAFSLAFAFHLACSQGPSDGPEPPASSVPLNPGTTAVPNQTAPQELPPANPTTGVTPDPANNGSPPPDATQIDPPAGGTGNTPGVTPPPSGGSGAETTDSTGTATPDGTTEPPPAVETEFPSLIGAVEFSPPSGTFQGELKVEMTGPAGAEIRYSTDGMLPTADSPLYDPAQGLILTETAQVRVQAYVEGKPSGLPSTAMYVARNFDYESDVPIVILEGYGGGRPQKEVSFGGNTEVMKQPYFDAAILVFEPVDGVARISDPPTLATRAGYRERGQSSASFEKSPYRVEFWDNNNEDADLPFLGMPPEGDWTMIGPYMDKTLIRNALVYSWGADLGLETMELRFAEVFINFDGGPLEESDYFGVYAFTEKIKNQKYRVDLKQLDASVTSMPEITGGYMIKFDQAALDGDEVEIVCTGSELFQGSGGFFGGGMGGGFGGGNMGGGSGAEPAPTGNCFQYLGIIDPDPPNQEQVDYITGYIQEFHDALHQTPMGDLSQYIDIQSFIDHMLINELTMDVDAYVRSSYLHKDREGLLKMGPLWDYNFALGSVGDGVEDWRWQTQATSRGTVDWYRVLGEDPQFLSQLAARWRELRQGVFAMDQINARIDEICAPLVNAAPRDLQRWPVGDTGGFFGGGMGGGTEQPQDWEGQVDAMRDWIARRLEWIDANLAGY